MRWPWSRKPERRESGGGYSDAILAAIEAQASAKVADASATAAIEAAAGLLSRAFASAAVDGPGWARDAISPVWLAQVGRSLIREGESLSVMLMRDGRPELVPAASWDFGHARDGANDEIEATWRCRATTYGPTSTTSRWLGREQVVFIPWGTSPGIRYRGRSPMGWAATTARLHGEVERSLADESAGPLAQILSIPEGANQAGEADGDDPLASLRATIGAARGKALTLETTASGWADKTTAPPPGRDWKPSRLGPQPPEAMVRLADAAFARMLAACGCSPALFDDSDGTAKREAQRQFFLGTVQPIAAILEYELRLRLEADVSLRFDLYNVDLAGRAQAFQKLVAGGMDAAKAAAVSGLMAD